MRAAVTRARGSMEVVDVPGRERPAQARCSWPRRRWACAAPTSTTSSATSARSTTRRALPADPGARGRGAIVGRRPGLPRRTSSPACASPSGRSTPAVECYPCRLGRGNACVEHQPDGYPRRRRAAGAARPPRRAGVPGRRPGSRRSPRSSSRSRSPCAPWCAVVSRPASTSSSSAPARSGRRWRWRRPTAARRSCSSTRSRAAWPAGRALGADMLHVGPDDDLVAAVREWSGTDGPEVVIEATGVPGARADRDRARGAGRPRRRRRALERARPGPRRRPPVQGDRRARHELLRLRRLCGGRRSGREAAGRGGRPGHARVHASSRRRRRWRTRWSTRLRS